MWVYIYYEGNENWFDWLLNWFCYDILIGVKKIIVYLISKRVGK